MREIHLPSVDSPHDGLIGTDLTFPLYQPGQDIEQTAELVIRDAMTLMSRHYNMSPLAALYQGGVIVDLTDV